NDSALGSRQGCELPPELPKKWPLGIDRIKDLWETNAEGRLLAYLCKVAEEYEPRNNISQFLLLGPRAFHVLHPSNVKAILSTNFKGEPRPQALSNQSFKEFVCSLDVSQTMALAPGEMAFLPRRDLPGSNPGNFCENNLVVSNIRTWTTSASMSTI
ncbi:hypothetical protein N7522_006388, partial [Penicillium canescens]